MRFEILPGLPSSGPPALYFTERGKFSEGVVVRFYPKRSEPWVGNFFGGLTEYNAVLGRVLINRLCDQCPLLPQQRR